MLAWAGLYTYLFGLEGPRIESEGGVLRLGGPASAIPEGSNLRPVLTFMAFGSYGLVIFFIWNLARTFRLRGAQRQGGGASPGREAGFSEAREIYVDPAGLDALYRYDR